MPTWLETSRQAPTGDMLRTQQSTGSAIEGDTAGLQCPPTLSFASFFHLLPPPVAACAPRAPSPWPSRMTETAVPYARTAHLACGENDHQKTPKTFRVR